MSKIEITKEMLLAARDYVPIEEKEQWAAETAQKCFDRLAITADDEPVPPMYMLNYGLKSRYLAAVLAEKYLNADYEADEKDTGLMSVAEYDKWAGGHVLNQIERWKRDNDVRDKCFDILADYKELSKHLSVQIEGMLRVQNDELIRQNEYTKTMYAELPKVIADLQELQRKAGVVNGDTKS